MGLSEHYVTTWPHRGTLSDGGECSLRSLAASAAVVLKLDIFSNNNATGISAFYIAIFTDLISGDKFPLLYSQIVSTAQKRRQMAKHKLYPNYV